MAFDYQEVVPWGRSYDEYVAMFSLSRRDLASDILGCGDGPASFNAELTRRGGRIRSVDPVYRLGPQALARRIEDTRDEIMAQLVSEKHRFVWDHIPSPQALARVRLDAMNHFLDDYELGRFDGRYILGQLPELPFPSRSAELALCAHLLLFYSEQLPLTTHIASTKELLRVGREVRLFPLVDTNARPSPHLSPVIDAMRAAGGQVVIETVDYEFQRGGNEMLVIRRGGGR